MIKRIMHMLFLLAAILILGTTILPSIIFYMITGHNMQHSLHIYFLDFEKKHFS
jgi:hypothetical protein